MRVCGRERRASRTHALHTRTRTQNWVRDSAGTFLSERRDDRRAPRPRGLGSLTAKTLLSALSLPRVRRERFSTLPALVCLNRVGREGQGGTAAKYFQYYCQYLEIQHSIPQYQYLVEDESILW